MNCHVALERLLVADLHADGSVDDVALRSHLGHCSRCAAVAARLRSDTRVLAAAVAAPRDLVRSTEGPRRLWFAWPAVAMVAIAVFAVARVRPSGEAGTVMATSAASADTAVPSPQSVVALPGMSPAAPRPSRRVTARRRVPETPRVVAAALGNDLRGSIAPFTAAPFVPERTTAEAAVVDSPQPINHAEAARAPVFSVDPMVGTRAMVARTADPRITVVWLY